MNLNGYKVTIYENNKILIIPKYRLNKPSCLFAQGFGTLKMTFYIHVTNVISYTY